MAEYLDSNPEPEPSGVNKFLKGLGESGPPQLQTRSQGLAESSQSDQTLVFRKQDEAAADQVKITDRRRSVRLLTRC